MADSPTNCAEMTTGLEERLADNGDISGLVWIAQPRDSATFDERIDTTNQPLQPTPDAIRKARITLPAVWTEEKESPRRFGPHRVLGPARGWFSAGCTVDSAGVGDLTAALVIGGFRCPLHRRGTAEVLQPRPVDP